MDIVDKLIKDIENGIRQTVGKVRSKTAMVMEKADELTEEGKKQYRLYELKNKRQKQFSELGEKLYILQTDRKLKIPNNEIASLLALIDKTSAEIAGLEGKSTTAPSQKVARKRVAVKPKPPTKKKSAPKVSSDQVSSKTL